MNVWLEKLVEPRFGWWRGLLLVACLMAGLHVQTKVYHLDISVGAKIPPKAVAQVFYSYGGKIFPEQNSQVMLTYQGADGEITYEARLRSWKPIRLLRLDLSNLPGKIDWSSLTVRGASGAVQASGRDLPTVVGSYVQLELVSGDAQGQHLVAAGNDPQVLVDISREVTDLPPMVWWRHWLSILAGSLLLVGAFEYLLRVLRRDHPLNRRATVWLTGIAERFSEDATIRFSPASLMVYVVLMVLGTAWVTMNLNQSSVGAWENMFPAEFVDHDFRLGRAREIRSDEWNTMTPWTLSQVQSGMKRDNPNLGAPSAALLAGAPQMGPWMIAQPKYWGFVFLDLERGFSWLWAAKTFGLIAAFFTLLLLLTKSDVVISLAGALGLWGSSYVQWWLSSVPAEVIAGFSAAVVGSVYLLQARKTGGLLFGAVLVTLSVTNLLLHLYPPYLQPLAYLSLFVLIGWVGNRQGLAVMRDRLCARIAFASGTLALLGAMVGVWYLEVADAIQLVLNTDYPGHRISLGGGYPLSRLFYGVFESWKVHDDSIPFPPINPSEASRLWVLFPFAWLLVSPREWVKPAMRPVAWMMAFCLMTLAWTSFPLPAPVRAAMAAMGWYLTPSTRGDFALSVGSAVLMATLIAGIARGQIKAAQLPSPMVAGLAFIGVFAFGMYLQTVDPLFFHFARVLLGSVVVAAMVWAMHAGNRKFVLFLTVVAAVPTLHVNPIQSGLGPYLHKSILQKAKAVGGEPGDVWVSYGNTEVAQGLKAVGLQVVNGTHYAPRMQWIDILDPDHKYQHVWNRYAHIDWEPGEPGARAIFKIAYADSYIIKLDVCHPELRRLGVTRIASTLPLLDAEKRCLVPLLTGDPSGVSLYKFTSP